MLAKTFTRANALVYGAVLLGVLVYAFILIPNGFFKVPRLKTQDLYFRASHWLNPLPPQIKDIVLVSIDDESLALVNQKWPWERDQYAFLMDQISRAGAKVVGMDIVFLGKSVHGSNDRAFARALSQAGNVVLASYFSDNAMYVKPQDLFAQAASGYGLINKPRDADNVVRSARLWMRHPGDGSILDYGFEMKTLCRYWDIGAEDFKIGPGFAAFGERRVPLQQDGSFLVDYIAEAADFTTVPVWKIMQRKFDARALQGKIVLIGQTNEIIHDIHPTPLGEMPGVVISANVLLTILSGRYLRLLSPYETGVSLLLGTLLLLFLTRRGNAWKAALGCTAYLLAYALVTYALFRHNLVGDFFSVPFLLPVIFVLLQLYRNVSLFVENAILQHDAITDGLTGLFIHRYLMVRLQNEWDRAHRYGQKLALALLDIDFFKKLNDNYGHEEGNRALKHFSGVLRDCFRKSDLLFRYGGEEFCVLLPGIDAAGAQESLERFRKALEASDFRVNGKPVAVTVSIGLASVPNPAIADQDALMEAADKALYQAKQSGRNKVRLFLA